MDCKTARTLLEFARPTAPDLDADDRHALAAHLAVCSDCDALARAERQADEHLSQAIRDVPVPQGLRERLLERLKDERDAWFRKVLARGARWMAAAAALALVVYGGMLWMAGQKPRPEAEELAQIALEKVISPPDQAGVKEWFSKKYGIDVVPPGQFDYAYLTAYNVAEFDLPPTGSRKGKVVEAAQLLFVRVRSPGQGAQVAMVFILPDKEADLGAIVQKFKSQSGDNFKVEVWPADFSRDAYVILYTGDLNDLLRSKIAREGN